MSLHIIKPGLLTTLQDAGRTGLKDRGINPCGVMDLWAMRAANSLLGNDEDEAVLEMHFPAAEIIFQSPALICIGGADFGACTSSNIQPEVFQPFFIQQGERLFFDSPQSGSRTYLAIHGGWDVPLLLNSRSTHLGAGFGGWQGRALRRQDTLPYRTQLPPVKKSKPGAPLPWKLPSSIFEKIYKRPALRILPGPEWDWLSDTGRRQLLNSHFLVSKESNRTGYRLHGTDLQKIRTEELLSGPVCFGTVQLLPGGQLIVLMADAPVTGGYPRVAQVITADLSYLAQMRPGQSISFALCQQREAELSYLSIQQEWAAIRSASLMQMQAWLQKQLT